MSHIYFSNRSAAYFELKQFEESLKDAESAIQINPTYWKVSDYDIFEH
jgi:small glutamine-rich tetratricopeptide repeat-containing protein alpha